MILNILLFVGMLTIGILLFAYGFSQIILYFTCTIRFTRALSKSIPCQKTKIYQAGLISFFIWSIVSALVIGAVLIFGNEYANVGFFSGIYIMASIGLRHYKPNENNLMDYWKTYGHFYDYSDETAFHVGLVSLIKDMIQKQQNPLTRISFFISTIASVAGIISFFMNYATVTLICAAIALLDSVIQVLFGTQNQMITQLGATVIGIIISMIFHTDVWNSIALMMCLEPFVLLACGLISMLRRRNKSAKSKILAESAPEVPAVLPVESSPAPSHSTMAAEPLPDPVPAAEPQPASESAGESDPELPAEPESLQAKDRAVPPQTDAPQMQRHVSVKKKAPLISCIALALALIVSAGLNVYQYIGTERMASTIETMDSELSASGNTGRSSGGQTKSASWTASAPENGTGADLIAILNGRNTGSKTIGNVTSQTRQNSTSAKTSGFTNLFADVQKLIDCRIANTE